MTTGRRVEGDDLCFIACPSGPPPTCPKMACHRALMIFEKDLLMQEKKPKKEVRHGPGKR